MRKLKRVLIVLLTAYCLLHTPVLAQAQAGTDVAVLKAGVGARPLGMGSAFTAIANNADAPYWNPAGLGWVSSSEITTSQTKLSTDADHYYVSFVRPAFGGALGVSWIQVGLGDIEINPSREVVWRNMNEVQPLGIFNYFSNAYLLSWGRKLSDRVAIGLTGKYLTSDMFGISGGQAWGYSVTPGVLIKFGSLVSAGGVGKEKGRPAMTVGVKLDELINAQQWGTGTIEQVPPKLRLGLAYQAPNPGVIAVDISQIIKSGYSPELSAGYEWSAAGLSLRVGYSDGGLTAGAGFTTGHARVDYAYVTQRAMSVNNVHRVSLSGVW